MRISQEDENSQGTAGDQPSPQSRSQKTLRLKFPKAARLRSRSDYRRVLKASCRIQGESICIDFYRGSSPVPKLGITVSKKYGKAHARNYFKRLVREAFREISPSLPQGLEINVLPLHGLTQPSKKGIIKDLNSGVRFYAQCPTEKSR